ncbi:MAG TPA: efflux RND transporter periplasmic adaptor subunit [Roseiflexaceae bacterium]|nr:efflux RND transporter periplasmic adaptor subunit [Roseiflexaceae bacterium]
MNMRTRIIILLVALIALAGGSWWWGQRAAAATASSQLSGSGTIEAAAIVITAEVGGRIKWLPIDEGQEVAVGQTLAQLDRDLLEAQFEQAGAAVAAAEANLAQLKAGTREEEVVAAQAQVDQAQALRDGAARAYENALKILNNPQELEAQVLQAQAARDTAWRALAQVRAGSRSEDIAVAEAALSQAQINVQSTRDKLSQAKSTAEAQVQQVADALTQAQAGYAQAKNNWERVQNDNVDPMTPKSCNQQTGQCKPNRLNDAQRGSYYSQYIQAEAAMHQAENAVQQAVVAAEQARKAEVIGIQAAEAQTQSAQATRDKVTNGASKEELAAAQTALSGAQRMLDMALSIRNNPLQLQAAVDTARTQLDSAEAQLAQARARLALAKNGARPEQIQAAEAQLAQARAAQRQIEVQLGKTTLVASRAGIVLSRALREGEQATPGATIMTIGTLDTVRLTLYIPETTIGRVRLGQHATVTVDSFPGRVFAGTVTFIAQEAQFTPRNVQTKDQRATTVFAVRVDLANADHTLKPGMPADGVIIE